MAIRTLPDAGTVRECLDYDPATGIFRWRRRPHEHFPTARIGNIYNARRAGKPAGFLNPNGYITIRLRLLGAGGLFHAHRLAWLLMHGEPMPIEIDHADGNPSNNRIGNLRAATRGQNAANNRRRHDSTTGAKGVSLCHYTGRYRAIVTANGKRHCLGRFDTIEEAAQARREAAIRLHGAFARHD